MMQELEMKCYGIHVLCSSTYYSDPKLKEVSVLRLCENRIRNNETSTSTCDLYINLTPTDIDQYAIPNFSIVSWKCSSLVIPLKRRDSDVVPW